MDCVDDCWYSRWATLIAPLGGCLLLRSLTACVADVRVSYIV